ncbi:LuxR family transcriptional regulator [Novispirillum sp. DQ9]|uniref:LuxR family transcriptional regulator n=1 Tax=Novispirillum sp. DQ9 TaxID=3398612 RepID=UPI003C7E9FCA
MVSGTPATTAIGETWGPLGIAYEQALVGAAPKDVEEVSAVLDRLAVAAGFRAFLYAGGTAFNPRTGGHRIWARTPLVVNSFPGEWIRTYHENDFGTIDPVLAGAMAAAVPFVWDAEQVDRARLDRPVAGFLSAGHDYGVTRGLTIPVYGPAGGFGLFTFLHEGAIEDFRRVVDLRARELHLACLYYHPVIQRLEEHAPRPTPKLTAREKEVLYWAAEGKTSDETGVILSVAEKTVQYHMYNALRKLDCYTKPQAVAKAILMGLIRP